VLGLVLTSFVIGVVIACISGFGILGIVAGAVIFICGLPFALIGDFVHSEVSYAQDNADYRQELSQLEADMRADKVIKSAKPPVVFNDNRQVHLHNK